MALAVEVLDDAGAPAAGEDAAAWRAALTAALADEGVEVVAAGEPATPLEVLVRRLEGPGRTDAGTTYVAVRYDAVLRVHRAEVPVRGAPGVGTDAAPRDDARVELIRRIVPIVAY